MTKKIMSFMKPRFVSDNIKKFVAHQSDNWVGVHIRLKDFINYGWTQKEDYAFFRAGIAWFRERYQDSRFFIFSDDINVAREILGVSKDLKYISFDDIIHRDMEEFFCFSYCKHKILTKTSGYGRLATVVNQYRSNNEENAGINIIIDKVKLAETADNKEILEKIFNNQKSFLRDSDFGRYVTLNKREIEELDNRYVCFKQPKILFLTFHYYSEFINTGMQYIACDLSQKGYEVNFVGEKLAENLSLKSVAVTIDSRKTAKNKRGDSYGYNLFPYIGLKTADDFREFIDKLHEDNEKLIVITRKPLSIPKVNTKNANVHYIFIDYTDPCDMEYNELSKNELEYMYNHADKVITFSYDVYSAKRQNGININYIDIDAVSKQYVKTNERVFQGTEKMFHLDELANLIEESILDIAGSARSNKG